MRKVISASLVIPTYNRAALIGETINAALSQTRPFAEIIVVDDGSTDDTVALLRQYGDRIRIVEPGKIGLQAARNAGVAAATSEYITFCDSDDLLQPGFLATVVAFIAGHPEWDSVYVNYRSFTASGTDGAILANAPPDFLAGARHAGSFIERLPDLYARTFSFQPLLISGATVRKTFYESIGGFNTSMNGIPSEDWEYTLRAIAMGTTAICIEPLVKIRRHAGNQSRNHLRQVLGEVEILKFALHHHLLAKAYRDALMHAIRQRRHRVFYESFRQGRFDIAGLVYPLLEDCPRTLRFRIKALTIQAYLAFHTPDAKRLFGFQMSHDTVPHPLQAIVPAPNRG